jgi:hypothetical protein
MADIYLSSTTGKTVTAQLYSNATATGTPISMQEIATTGEYLCNVPPGTAAGKYLVVFVAAGLKIASGTLEWDGAAEVTVASRASQTSVTALGSPMQASAYTAPNNTSIAAIKVKTDTLVNGPTLAAIEASTVLAKETTVAGKASQASVTALGTPMQAASYTAPDNTGIAAIKAKTDTITQAPSASDIKTAMEVAGGKLDKAMKAAQSAEDQTA